MFRFHPSQPCCLWRVMRLSTLYRSMDMSHTNCHLHTFTVHSSKYLFDLARHAVVKDTFLPRGRTRSSLGRPGIICSTAKWICTPPFGQNDWYPVATKRRNQTNQVFLIFAATRPFGHRHCVPFVVFASWNTGMSSNNCYLDQVL